MDLTEKLNVFQRAPSSKIVRARYMVNVQIPVSENGHSRSHPAEVERTDLSPRFRTSPATELPVEIGQSATSCEPAWEPIADPTLEKALPAE